MRSGSAGELDRRGRRAAPRARLRPCRIGSCPALLPSAWYPLYTAAPAEHEHVWLRAPWGLLRVPRDHVELCGAADPELQQIATPALTSL